ncbi:uncharacterized protein MONOS_5366 [Monocercomonoides exilis]|uniref:uncharacterized protein n=1 Tax=Monocercomonoides exilis TaxID=2049356 RepID=UPI00355967F9|nr:hypothetical protein MONOS_5366 [Monocercomonoides exilis]|eukprot:MONOS_5366.1-p1 / transcript=MONOS_5366.1 / gene=MONOS_5366 / organism=Monocercomonoides_exilis_PA203 / gene_product=unspecified product / transcript_product=unspecified product / location=Mono_scaffold00155:48785-49711(-) / protein_length=283 / sequence_SO=supercontig / SO=protein_coding / is_pseudo=false
MLYRRWVYAAMMLRTPFLTDHAFSAVVPMDAPMVLKMAAEDVQYNFVSSSSSSSSSSAAAANATASAALCGNEEEMTQVAKFRQVELTNKYREHKCQRLAFFLYALSEQHHFFLVYTLYLFGCQRNKAGSDAFECMRVVFLETVYAIKQANYFVAAVFAERLTDDTITVLFVSVMEADVLRERAMIFLRSDGEEGEKEQDEEEEEGEEKEEEEKEDERKKISFDKTVSALAVIIAELNDELASEMAQQLTSSFSRMLCFYPANSNSLLICIIPLTTTFFSSV